MVDNSVIYSRVKGKGYSYLRLLWRLNSETLMIATGQNLKRLLKKRGWGRLREALDSLSIAHYA